MARPKINSDSSLESVSVRLDSALLAKIDRRNANESENTRTKKNRTDFIREACEFYASAIRCEKCGTINDPRALVCSLCLSRIPELPGLKTEAADLAAQIESLYMAVRHAILQAHLSLDEIWHLRWLYKNRKDILYDKTSYEEIIKSKHYDDMILEYEKKYARTGHLKDVDGKKTFIHEPSAVEELITRTRSMLQNIDYLRVENPKTKEMEPYSENMKIILFRDIRNECSITVEQLREDLKTIERVRVMLEVLKSEINDAALEKTGTTE